MSVDVDVDSESVSWLGFFVFLLFFFLISWNGCNKMNANDNEAMIKLVANGATAVEARCAVKDASSTICALEVAKSK